MNKKFQISYLKLVKCYFNLKPYQTFGLILNLVGLPLFSFGAAGTWNGGTSTDWNTAANWTGGVPSGGNATINTTNPRIATITATISATPVDIVVGGGAAVTGRVDQISGNAFTGNGNWLFVGFQGGRATYNLADTTTSGGTFTGYGRGSGNLIVGNGNPTSGNLHIGLDAGTVGTFNMNSSGTLSIAQVLVVGSADGGVGTFNLDNGTVVITNDAQFGSTFYGGGLGGGGTLNMSGGSLTANNINFSRGSSGSSTVPGTGTITGGTLNARAWFTLGFAGTSAAVGTVTNSGGTININKVGGGNMEMTVYDAVGALFVQNSGAVNLCNNAYISYGNGGNNSGVGTFNQEGGTVTFYSDAGTAMGGTGYLNLGNGGSTGTYTYNLDGGTLTVPKIQKSGAGASGTFNFNGGTLKPTTSTTTFMQGLSAANVMAGGGNIDTTNFNITVAQMLQDGGGGGGLTKLGNGTLTLAGGYSYSGPTTVRAGTLVLDAAQPSGSGTLTVSNATLALSLNNGVSSITVAGPVTFASNSVLNLNYGTAASPAVPAISAGGVTITGTNVVNITGTALVVGQYPLIYTGSSVPTNNFKLGPLPAGVLGLLTNSGSSLDLLITASGQNLTWYGADNLGNPLTTWDINTSSNWNTGLAKYLQYSGNSYGDRATFDDTVYPGNTSINLSARVVPVQVLFNSASQAYSLTGTGGIDGTTALVVTNTGSLFVGTSNNFTGGTFVGGGTLTITNNNALGNSSAGITMSGGTLQLNGPLTNSRTVTVTANSVIGVGPGILANLVGSIGGSGNLTKTGPGSLTIAGSENIPTNIMSAGVLNLTGSATNVTTILGDIAGNTVMNISGSLVAGNLFVGNVSGAAAATYQTGGFVSVNGGTGDNLSIGNWDGSFGYYKASGGTINVNGISIGGEENPNVWPPVGGGDGILEVNGATINNSGWITLARGGGPNNGVLNVYSGSLTYGGGGLACNWNGNAAAVTGAQTSIINVLGGALTSTNQGVNFQSAGNIGILNLNGGLLSGASVTGEGTVNFNGGTLQPCANYLSPFLNVSSNVYVFSGGAKIDDNGQSLTISQPFLSPAGSGVSGPVVISNPGSGYIAPPVVTISGDGTGATAIAQINRNAGTVTNVIITSPGINYTTATFAFSGGGATSQATASAGTSANVSGGLTKLGNGTLYFNAANTYTGITLVNQGTLAGTGSFVGPVQVALGGNLSPGIAGPNVATLNLASTLTLQGNATSRIASNSVAANDLIAGITTLNYGGTLTVTNVGTNALAAGNQFQLFSASAFTGNFTNIVGSPGAGLAYNFNPTNGVLSVVTGIASNPTNITASVSGGTLSLSWPADHLGWILQQQTNSLSVGLKTNWVDVAGSSSVTSTNITIDPTKPTVFYRLKH